MRLEQLHYLVEVAKHKSITAASESIHVSQPTISEALKNLEKELNAPLYVRNYYGVELTSLGEKVNRIAQNILSQIEDIKNLTYIDHNLKSNESGNLRVYIVPSLNQDICSKIIPLFSQCYPKIRLTINERDVYGVISSVLEEKGDIGLFGMNDAMLEIDSFRHLLDEGLEYKYLATTKMYAAVGRNSPFYKKRSASLKEIISKYPLILHDYADSEDILALYGKHPNIILKSNDIKLCAKMIEENKGIGFLSECSIKNNQFENIKFLPCKERFNYNIVLIFKSGINLSPYATEFSKLFLAQVF